MSTCNFPDAIPVADAIEFAQLIRDKQIVAQKWRAAQLLFCVGGSVAKKLEGNPVSVAEAAEFDQMDLEQVAAYIANNAPDGEVSVTANPLLEFAIRKLVELILDKLLKSF